MNYNSLLESKGFTLNQYPDAALWELVVENNEEQKRHICKIFHAVIDDFMDMTDINTLILQCTRIIRSVYFTMIVTSGIWKQINLWNV